MIKERCWSKRGVKVIGEKSGSKRGRTSVLAGLCNGKVIAPFYYQGHSNTELFLAWIEQILLPELKEGQYLILDNASWHKSPKVLELLARKKCKVLFLPPYSPDLNPIEQYWGWMKKVIVNYNDKFEEFEDRLSYVLGLSYVSM